MFTLPFNLKKQSTPLFFYLDVVPSLVLWLLQMGPFGGETIAFFRLGYHSFSHDITYHTLYFIAAHAITPFGG